MAGREPSMTVDRSPMSMPISRVGVATRTLGSPGACSGRLNPASTAARSSASSREVCSWESTRRTWAPAYMLR